MSNLGHLSLSELFMDEIEVDFLGWRPAVGILAIIEQVEVPPVGLVHQMDRQVVEKILHRMRPLGSVSFAFVEPGDVLQLDRMRRFDGSSEPSKSMRPA